MRNSKLTATKPVTATEAWMIYVEQMSQVGIDVEFGVATHEAFYEEALARRARKRASLRGEI